ncbi:MAG: PepSY-associated TM helix domain-containing protein [Bacteroides sp.]|nr:PepSY-associated TM helix domain-containing protein [Bacteroides sp.]
MKKLFRDIHLWLSVPFGLIITLICFSGAMLVFEDEVTECTHHDLYYVEQVGEKPLPVGKLVSIASHSLPDSVAITGVTVFSQPERAYQLSLSKPRRASMYIDQYTGEVKGKYERSPFFLNMFLLHRFLLDSMNPGGEGIFWGKLIVGISTLMFVIVLVSGIVIWWPRTRKALKDSLKITVSKGWMRLWYSLHVAGGMYALLFLLLMALTGLTWSFTWYRNGFYKLFGADVAVEGGYHGKPEAGTHGKPEGIEAGRPSGKPAGVENAEGKGRPDMGNRAERGEGRPERSGGRPENAGRPEGVDHAVGSARSEHHGGRPQPSEGQSEASRPLRPASPYACWQQVYEQLAMRNPGFESISLSNGSATVSDGSLGNTRASDSYNFDAQTGTIANVRPYKDADRATKIRGWIFSLHTGRWGGMLTRILSFVAALLGACLPLTGYYLWIKRLLRKKA